MVLEQESEELSLILDFISIMRKGNIMSLDNFNRIANNIFKFNFAVSPDDYINNPSGIAHVLTLEGEFIKTEVFFTIGFTMLNGELAIKMLALDYYIERLILTVEKINLRDVIGARISKNIKIESSLN